MLFDEAKVEAVCLFIGFARAQFFERGGQPEYRMRICAGALSNVRPYRD